MMTLTQDDRIRWADYLDGGLREGKELDRITTHAPSLSLEEAYLIQDEGIRLREKRGEKIIGFKMGLTSKAKREQMGLNTPIYGVLTDRMKVEGGRFSLRAPRSSVESLSSYPRIHPKIEPEIAFYISKDLRGPVTAEQVLDSCSGVSAALEILDSRYVGFKYFSLPDVVADNSSSAFFVLGEPCRDFRALDLAGLPMAMSVSGAPVQEAISGEISGNPIQSVIQLCDLLAARDLWLRAGSIVLAGAATVAVQLEEGQTVSLKVAGLPELGVMIG